MPIHAQCCMGGHSHALVPMLSSDIRYLTVMTLIRFDCGWPSFPRL